MGISKLVDIALIMAILGAISGNLPLMIKQVRKAQIQVIQESMSSNWGKPWTPPPFESHALIREH
jgi:hypothetical protein